MVSTLTGELRRLVDGVSFASFSPDDAKIAYIDEQNREIWLMSPNGGQRRRLFAAPTNRTVTDVAWTPDGGSVVYVARLSGSDPVIETRHIESGRTTIVATVPRLSGFCWTRDGRLLYTQVDPPPAQTYALWEQVIDPQTGRVAGEPRRLTRWAGLTPGSELSVSADGRRVMLTLGRGEDDVYVAEIFSAGPQLRNIKRLTFSNTNDVPTGWLLDSRTVLLDSNRNGNFDVFSQSLVEADATMRVGGPGDTRSAQVSPDRLWLLYLERQTSGSRGKPPARLMRAPLAGGSPELVLDIAEVGAPSPFLCPRTVQGPCVLYEKTETHDVFTTFSPTAGRGREFLRLPRTFARWALSPDGSQVAYMPVARTARSMTVVSVATGTSRRIDMGDLDRTNGFDWTTDGRALLFTQGTLRNTNVFYVPLNGKPQLLLTLPTNAASPFISPDGRRVAYSRYTVDRNAWLIELSQR